MDTLYYAQEVIESSPAQFVRFTHKGNRDLWVKRDKVNRSIVRSDAPKLVKMSDRGVTWEHIDGVSYAREPEIDELLRRSQEADKAWANDPSNPDYDLICRST